MIIGRSPLRISIGGGGTDLPSYYLAHGGFVLSAAITQYVYVTFQLTPLKEMVFRYSQIEKVKSVAEIKHPIIREALKLTGVDAPNMEVVSVADIPAGTGLGSSGTFTTCLLKVLHKHKRHFIHAPDLAEMACHIELDLLKEPIGKQDQYIAAFGGVTAFDFQKDGKVAATPLKASDEIIDLLEDNLVMVSTGYYRSASTVLKEQDDKSKKNDQSMIDNLHFVKDLGHRSREAIETGNLSRYGELMHEHWLHKKKRSPLMSNADIDRWYDLALANGAIGGKVIGAGGGGFLLFYTEEKAKLRAALRREGLMEIKLSFDYEGTKIL
ncbi:MAG: bifunctional fucokinase/L-fucose-P-guanylyltransferase [Myxococcales bacterium]|nr:bifunctional fucokinase/L-fucose-P-guanylyltransferase [Myxococcales bacterium]